MKSIGDKTRRDLGWPTLCDGWAVRCHTVLGSERAKDIATKLEISIEAAALSRARIAQAQWLRENDSPLIFAGISDIRIALARADKRGALSPEELMAVARTTQACAALSTQILKYQDNVPLLVAIAEQLGDHENLYTEILRCFGDDGRLADHASDRLGGLRRRVHQLVSQLDDKARSLLDDSRLHTHLQDRFYTQREDRYVVPVKVESRNQVPGIVHGTSQSGQTVFVEPQALVELNNKLKLAECDVADEERRIYVELSALIAHDTQAIRATLDLATELDVIDAAALLASVLGAHSPVVKDDGQLSLIAAQHPLMVLAGKPCVANDVVIEGGRGLVISGPNAGGKTVALKTAGLAALMVRAGLPVAAEAGSVVGWFASIESDIGDSQSLEMDLSTFSARLIRLGEFLDNAESGWLILVDEIAVGTEPEQGASLAQAVVEKLVESGATVIVTTHYERLKMLAGSDPRFENASVGFDMERLEPTFKLSLGTPGASGALRVATRLGLANNVIERARVLLGDSRAAVDDLIATLEESRGALEREREQVRELGERAVDALASAQGKEQKAREMVLRAQRGAHSEATAALKVARRELDIAKKKVRKRIKIDSIKQLERDIDEAARVVSQHAPSRPDIGRVAGIDELIVGAHVYVASLGAYGKISEPVKGKKVTVAIGSLRSQVAIGDIRIESARSVKKASKVRPPLSCAHAIWTGLARGW